MRHIGHPSSHSHSRPAPSPLRPCPRQEDQPHDGVGVFWDEVLGAPADGGGVKVAVAPGLDTQPKHLAVGQDGRASGVRSPDPIRPDERAQACRQLRRQVPDPRRTKRPASGKGSRRRERVKC